MNSSRHIAHVSATVCPPPGLAHKRHFEPVSHTIFSDIKKRKLEHGTQKLQPSFLSDSSFGSFLNSTEDTMQNWSTPQKGPGSLFMSASVSSDSKNCPVEQRHKFKARPIPKTLYKPDFIPKTNERMPTVPQEFQLSTQSPFKQRQQSAKSDTFRARPMPNFSRPWLPQNCFTPSKNHPPDINCESQFFDNYPGHFSISTPPSQKRVHTPTATSRNQERNLTPSRFYTNGFNYNKANEICQNPNKLIKDFEPTIPMDIEFHTAKRAQEREIYEERRREQERLKEAMNKIEAEEKARIEAQEMRMIRKQLEFKARPMPNFRSKTSIYQSSQYENSEDMMDIE